MAAGSKTLANRILAGLIIGALAGVLILFVGARAPAVLQWSQTLAVWILDPLGQVFLRMLFFVVIPLVFVLLAGAVMSLGGSGKLGPIALRTFPLFFLNMAIAVTLGLVMMNVVRPGEHMAHETRERLMAEFGSATHSVAPTTTTTTAFTPAGVVDMLMPRNLLGAFVGNRRDALGEVLPLIVFAILVGVAGTRLQESRRRSLQEGLATIAELMSGIVHLALKLAPYAVPAMIFSVVVKAGVDVLLALGLFVLGCGAALLLHLFGTMSLWLRFLTDRGPLETFKGMREALITAFSTSSSTATLPTALTVAREQLGISESTSGFVLPLGTTMNTSGSALYEGCVVLFIAQVFGVHLTIPEQISLLLMSVVTATAVAGIPGGSLPLIAGLLATFGIPPEGIGIVLGADRLLDMTRTMVSVGSDIVTCAVVDASMQRAKVSEAS